MIQVKTVLSNAPIARGLVTICRVLVVERAVCRTFSGGELVAWLVLGGAA